MQIFRRKGVSMESGVLIGIGFVGAFVSGLLGIGGAILLVPMLLYVPPGLGLPGFRMGDVAGMTIVQVLVASLVGMLTHRKQGAFSTKVALPMAIAIGFGAAAGGLASGRVPDVLLKALFALLALVAALLMVWPVRAPLEGDVPEDFQTGWAAAIAGTVGVLSGLVGAGGAFMLAPMMRSVLRLPIRGIIGSSLAIVLSSAVLGTIGKAVSGQIPWAQTAFLVVGSMAGAPLGAKTSHRLNVQSLRWMLAGLIALTAGNMLWKLRG